MSVRQIPGAIFILASGIAFAMVGMEAFAQNLIVQWKFDEPAGGMTDALDTGAAPATTGVLGSTATRTTDTPGGGSGFALDISAAGSGTSIVDGGNPLEVDTLTQFTFSTWLKVTGAADYNEGGSGNVRLLAKQSGGLYDGFTWNLNPPQQGSVRSNNAFTTGLFIGGQTAFAFSYANADILDRGGDWLFLAVTYDGTSTVDNAKFYIGDETTAVSQLGTTVTIDAGQVFSTNTSNGGSLNARFAIGLTDAAPAADTALSGYQDDLRVYDGVLDLTALDGLRLENLPSTMGVVGDYNDNDVVDAADYAVWRDNEGTSNALPNDPIGGVIGSAHYDQWRSRFGNTSGAGAGVAATAVPEPSTLSLTGLGLVLAGLARGRRVRRLLGW